MLKALKYYDLDNDGGLNPNEFKQACEKLGILIPTQQVRPNHSLILFAAGLDDLVQDLRSER